MKHLRTMISVSLALAFAAANAATWTVPGDFATIQDAIDSSTVMDGDTIRVQAGDHAGAIVNKAVTIKGDGDARITTGPNFGNGLTQGFRLVQGSSGATISHLTFTTDLSIYSRFEANQLGGADNVTVTQCTFLNSNQAITVWGGRAWEITHNTITDLKVRDGGGIGVLIGDRFNRIGGVTDNVVSHNTITGRLNVPATDGGGYNGSGIVIYADFRGVGWGGLDISYNRVVKNKVSMTLNNLQATPNVDIVAFEMTDTRELTGVIQNNAVGFNDFRGTTLQIVLTPSGLDAFSDISRNFGESRGHGLHPGAF